MEHDGVFPRGSVKKIRVTDLMSFVGTLELVPGARVNLITGPNGSGKSSLVTALCVGLAGGMKARVKELTRQLGIYFDNLCQFLPQERVSEFAALSAVELLENTEKVIGDGHLLRTHQQLVDRSKALRAKREDLARTRDLLAKLQKEQADAEPEYRRLQRRDELKEEVKRITQKLRWVEKQAKEAAVRRAQQAVQAAAARVAAVQREVDQAQAPLTALNHDRERLDQAAAGRVRAIEAQARKVETARRHLEAAEVALKQREEELQGLRARSDRWRAEVARCQEGLRKVAADQAAAPTALSAQQAQRLEEIAGELQAAAGEVGGAEAQVNQKNQEVLGIERDVQRLETAEQRRTDRREALLCKLDGAQRGSRQLVEWLAATRAAGGFRGRVLGPVLLELSPVADAAWAGYLEQYIGRRGLCTVMTEQKEDNNKVQDWLEANGCTHQLMYVRGGAQPVTHPDGEPGAYTQKYGITHTLDQLFEAPDLIKTALCNSNGINTVYVGNNTPVFTALLRDTPVTRVFTPLGLTVATHSRYERGYTTQKLAAGAAGAEEEEQQERAALQRRRQELDDARRELVRLESELAQRRTARDALHQERQRLLQARQRIQTKLAELERAHGDYSRRLQRLTQEGDPLGAVQQLSQRLAEEVDRFARLAGALGEQVRQQHELHRQLAPLQLQAAEMAARKAPLQRAYQAAVDRLAAETQAKGAAQQALDNLRGDEVAVLAAWSRREGELREEGAKAAAYEADVGRTSQEVEELKASWLPELQGHMAAVNEALRRNFAAIGCAGEVALTEAGDAFESYAAEIRVQYRAGEGLRALDRNHHSGGERSVATMLYLIALQGVTRTPFRVVDEINQGMDSRNERKVFNLLVESSSRPDTPQCFLLTPKLIANLQYNEHVRVHDLKPIRNDFIVMTPGLLPWHLLKDFMVVRRAAVGGEQN
eukprot:XP_001690369.1 structural maintenance of chromosomes protein 5A [Chlamydomonas reinhardtii]